MSNRPKVLLAALMVFLVGAVQPATAGQTAELAIESRTPGGKLFRESPRPVSASLKIRVIPQEDAATVTPMINSRVTFPAEMSFNPDASVTPICPKAAVGPTTNLSLGVAAIVELCPRSVIGTGTAGIYLSGQPDFRLPDPKVVIFNAGRTTAGHPRIRLYSFSKLTASGLLMEGSLDRRGRLEIPIGVLPFDSAISDITLGIPGEVLEVEDETAPSGKREVSGLDPGYLRAVCPDGSWEASGRFSFATRDEATGQLTSPVAVAPATAEPLPCNGRAGVARLAALKVKGKRMFRPGGERTLKVLIRNIGTASARQLTVKVSGGGKGRTRAGRLSPGTRRNFPVRVRFPRAGKGRRKLKIQVKGRGVRRAVTLSVRRFR